MKKVKWMRAVSYLLRYIGIPFFLEFVIESLNRKSVISCAKYMVNEPVLFVFNTLIIMLSVSVALFFRREIFVFSFVSLIWLFFGITNFVILQMRVTPFSAVDITLLKSAIAVSGHYLSALNIAAIIVATVMVLILVVCLWRRAPRHAHVTRRRVFASLTTFFAIAFTILFLHNESSAVQALSTEYTNISEAYENYGFVYCFTNSIVDTGIERPEDYSKKSVEKIISKLPEDTEAKETPNIIFVQLESFFDLDSVSGLALSADALPNFHYLQQNYSSGLLTVPTVGAGTVNTEYEVLTGISQKYFGTSEYPYKTILRNTTSESICYDLKEYGYTSHCVHNNTATFYGRNEVFKNLGFDSFTSMEMMNGLEDNPNGWKKDAVLVDEIIDTLNQTDGADFTLAITVQSHGKYQGFSVSDCPVKVLDAPGEDKDSLDTYQYYVSQLVEVDQMIGDLVAALNERREDTILVLYGDHLPSLDLTQEDLTNGSLYQTPYVIWDNFGLNQKHKDLTAYQLYPYVLKRLGMTGGNISKLHQKNQFKEKRCANDLQTLAYDMYYGKNYAADGKTLYEPTDLAMGTKEITVTGAVRNGSGILISGTGFTPYAHVLCDGKELSCQFVDGTHLQITDTEKIFETNNQTKEITVQIRADSKTVLAESSAFAVEIN